MALEVFSNIKIPNHRSGGYYALNASLVSAPLKASIVNSFGSRRHFDLDNLTSHVPELQFWSLIDTRCSPFFTALCSRSSCSHNVALYRSCGLRSSSFRHKKLSLSRNNLCECSYLSFGQSLGWSRGELWGELLLENNYYHAAVQLKKRSSPSADTTKACNFTRRNRLKIKLQPHGFTIVRSHLNFLGKHSSVQSDYWYPVKSLDSEQFLNKEFATQATGRPDFSLHTKLKCLARYLEYGGQVAEDSWECLLGSFSAGRQKEEKPEIHSSWKVQRWRPNRSNHQKTSIRAQFTQAQLLTSARDFIGLAFLNSASLQYIGRGTKCMKANVDMYFVHVTCTCSGALTMGPRQALQPDYFPHRQVRRNCVPQSRDTPPKRDTGIASEKDWGITLNNGKTNESGVNEDGSTWYRENGVDIGDNGYRCRWTVMGGQSADSSIEWKEAWWEKSDWTGYKELGAEKSGKNAAGDSWWETWQEVLRQDDWSNLARIEKSAQKQAKSGDGVAGWYEKWWEKYNAKGWTDKGAHKYGRLNDQAWWEKWGEQYDGQGAVLKWTDKWAENAMGEKWGDKWEERFEAGLGTRQGETWHASAGGERWSRTWGEEHFGSRKVHKYGKSSSGESWDNMVEEGTFYKAEPHYGWADAVGSSAQLLSIEPLERPPGVYPDLDFGPLPPPPP